MFRLMPDWEPLGSQAGQTVSKSLALPEVVGVILRLADQRTDEYIDVTRPVITKRPSNFSAWIDEMTVLESRFSASATELWQFYQLMSLQVNIDAEREKTTI